MASSRLSPPEADSHNAVMLDRLRLLRWRLAHPDLDRVRREVIRRALADPRYQSDAEMRAAVALISRQPLRHVLFPAQPAPRIGVGDVQWDASEGLHFVLHRGHRLYWHEGARPKDVARGYAGLVTEQQAGSPHCYCEGDFGVPDGAVVADLGAAEGIFSLDVVERARRVHLFECGAMWRRALAATFRPWGDKVVRHECLVGRVGQAGCVAIDELLRDEEAPDFYKLDIEGAEGDALHGATATLARARAPRIAVCAYHRQQDEADLTHQLQELGFRVHASRGWVLLYRSPEFGEPYFRRGVLRAER
jgi:hypothetical protein